MSTETETTRTDEPQQRLRRSNRRDGTNWPATIFIAICSLSVLIPLYFTVVTAFKTPDQLGGTGFELPRGLEWEKCSTAWELTNFPRALRNSLIVTVGSVTLTVLTNSMVAYAIARYMDRFRTFKFL